jgi:hypothetical protein
MEQEVRAILQERVTDRLAVLSEIEQSWNDLPRSPGSEEVDSWLEGDEP